MSQKSQQCYIYTDGSCLGNPGPGGWAAILSYDEQEKELSGGEVDSTNNRMELMAAIKALETLTRPMEVQLVADSSYVVDGITKWITGWKANGWKTADKKPVENRDLWERLDAVASTHQIDWQRVKGHSGHPMNERCDVLARSEAEKMKKMAQEGKLSSDK